MQVKAVSDTFEKNYMKYKFLWHIFEKKFFHIDTILKYAII